jgi:YD repeat-containing protein
VCSSDLDAMNRMFTARGQFSGTMGSGSIVRGTTGVDTFYNLDGTRAYTLTAAGGNWRDDYSYNALGLVTQVRGGTNLSAAGSVRGTFTYDALSRVLTQTDYNGTSGYLGGGAVYSRAVTYNDKNQVVSEDSSLHQADDIYRTLSSYNYGAIVYNGDGSVNTATTMYAVGSVLDVTSQRWKDGGSQTTTRTSNAYIWYDGAVARYIYFDGDINASSNTINTTTYVHDMVGGQAILEKATIADGRPRTLIWTNDMLGQVVRRSERDTQSGGDPHEIWHRFSGRQMGYVGNNPPSLKLRRAKRQLRRGVCEERVDPSEWRRERVVRGF